ncbi:MAG: hypothetical protein H6824_15045 [Planctomycetaceae bacterium]|nr:hypothetical protein [Planctomycetaceae bacterium]
MSDSESAQSKEPNDPEAAIPGETENQESQNAIAGDEHGTTEATNSSTPAEEEVPESEELTPEIFEDECQRGDAMLSWAALFVGVLLAWTYITDSSILVKIRSGEYMLSHGVLPPRADYLSGSANGQPWVNLGWLSDLVLGGLNALGTWAVTLFAVVCAAVGFGALSRISLPRISTWWLSICLVLAALAMFPVLQPGTGTVTLLGLGLLLYFLQANREARISGFTWKVGLLMFLWSNADGNAFLGLLVLLTWAIGESLSGQTPPATPESEPAPANANPWVVFASGFVAALIHPWHINVLLSPYTKLAIVGPEARTYAETGDMGLNWLNYGLVHGQFWDSLDVFAIVGLVLLGLSVIGVLLNLNRLDVGLTLAWFAVNLMGLFSGELFCCAAVLNALVAGLNAQDWFRSSFSQEYTIERWTVIKLQSGRALTVLAIFGVAYVMMNGMLTGAAGRRLGMGIDPRWRDRIEGIEQVLSGVPGTRVFPLRVDQGDLLIWVKKQPFVDSRLSLYAGGSDNLLVEHRRIRIALRTENPQVLGSGKPDVWIDGLQKHETSCVMPRLWGTADYATFFDLAGSNWQLTGFSGAAAVFVHQSLLGPEEMKFLQENGVTDFVKEGLREPSANSIVQMNPFWPTPSNVYDKWLVQKIPMINDGTQMAIHFDKLRTDQLSMLDMLISQASNPNEPNVEQYAMAATQSLPQSMGLILLSIRNARRGLEESIESGQDSQGRAEAYRVLRDSYNSLARFEQVLGERFGGVQLPAQLRTAQALAAARHAYLESGAAEDLYYLAQIQLQLQQFDLALNSLEKYQEMTGQLTPLPLSSPEGLEEQTQTEQVLKQLQEHVTSIRDAMTLQEGEDTNPQQLFGIAASNNCPGLALEVIERDKTILAENLELTMVHAEMLLTAGRYEEAWESLEALERRFPNERVSPFELHLLVRWTQLTAIANAVAMDLSRADELLVRCAMAQRRAMVNSWLEFPPLAYGTDIEADIMPIRSRTRMAEMLASRQPAWDQTMFNVARLRWELGDVAGTQNALEAIYNNHPNSNIRPLVAWMLTVITQKEYDPTPPTDEIPVTEDMFAPDEE